MSKDLQDQNKNNEEVDLLVLFNYLGDKINKFFAFVVKLIISIFSVFIYAVRAFINNIKVIALVVVISGFAGFLLEKTRTKKYDSAMLVRTHFGSKYQLSTNINYYNALIESEDYNTLASIFEIHEDTIAKVVNFEMAMGPETENERIREYDQFVSSIDSVRAQDINYDDFILNRDIYSGNLFEIRVESTKRDIFKNLETGINKSFKNIYSIEQMGKRDSMIVIKRKNILTSIQQIDSLKKVYIRVIENESENTKANLSFSDGFPLKQEKSETKEYQLLDKEIKLRDELRTLEEEKLEENVFYDVISSFQVVGNEVKYWYEKYTVVFPMLGFLLLCLLFMLNKFTVYVKNYEA
ncbi:hypothetical protein [Psychroserpens jangbogonensis]|uniref:hypothetical protein n=1 Tax=Psychroserpens jangbogonensis TaxID=1484460 RepID=UPI00053E5696|nr:hypothetical protein [Psychroserpens jangbogonensis]